MPSFGSDFVASGAPSGFAGSTTISWSSTATLHLALPLAGTLALHLTGTASPTVLGVQPLAGTLALHLTGTASESNGPTALPLAGTLALHLTEAPAGLHVALPLAGTLALHLTGTASEASGATALHLAGTLGLHLTEAPAGLHLGRPLAGTLHLALTGSASLPGTAALAGTLNLALTGTATFFTPALPLAGVLALRLAGEVGFHVARPYTRVRPFRVSQRFMDTLASSDQTRVVAAQIWSGNTVLAELGNVVSGSVNVDVTAPIRRTCSLSVASEGLGIDDLIPTSKDSLLNPASGNELRLFRGFDYDPGNPVPWQQRYSHGDPSVEMCPLGVFRMTKPTVTDTGDAITIDITGHDRAALVSARKWTDAYIVRAGTDVRTAVQNVLYSRIPDLGRDIYRLEATPGRTVPATVFGTGLSSGNDPMADAITLAAAVSMELFFDPNGNVVMQRLLNVAPTLDAAGNVVNQPDDVRPISFGTPALYEEGVNCTVTKATRTFDESATYNGVVVVGVGTGGAPVRAEVWDNDPASPTWVGGPWGRQPFIYQTSLIPASASTSGPVAFQQAMRLAQALFQQVRTMLDTPSIECVPNPALLESDLINLVRPRIGLDANYSSAQMTIPLDTTSAQTITSRPNQVPVGPRPRGAVRIGAPA